MQQLQIIPFHILFNGEEVDYSRNFKVTQLPGSLRHGEDIQLIPPSIEEYAGAILSLSKIATDILVISLSSQLTDAWSHAEEAVRQTRSKARVMMIDSQSAGIGLGYLVQTAAEMASRGIPATEIEYRIRGRIPHIYTQLCLPDTTYLQKTDIIGYPQAIVGEMISLLPVFTFEEGRLSPIEKVRNLRHMVENFQEFLDEFDDLEYIAFMQSIPPLTAEARGLKEHTTLLYPKTPFSEHTINPVLACLFGPHGTGVFAIEQSDSE